MTETAGGNPPEEFHLDAYRKWVSEAATEFEVQGFRVETSGTAWITQEVRLRIEGKRALAEAVVWETGSTSLQVCNLEAGGWIFDRHDIVLAGCDWTPVRRTLDMALALEEGEEFPVVARRPRDEHARRTALRAAAITAVLVAVAAFFGVLLFETARPEQVRPERVPGLYRSELHSGLFLELRPDAGYTLFVTNGATSAPLEAGTWTFEDRVLALSSGTHGSSWNVADTRPVLRFEEPAEGPDSYFVRQ